MLEFNGRRALSTENERVSMRRFHGSVDKGLSRKHMLGTCVRRGIVILILGAVTTRISGAYWQLIYGNRGP